jgi:phage terminase large subunit GpA-like protein
MFLTGVGYTLSRTLCRRAKAMLAIKGIFSNDNSTTITFPHCRWSFYGSDSKTYLGQSEVTYLVGDEISSFDPYSDWKASIDTFAIKNAGATIFLITTPSSKINSQAHRVFTEEDSKSLYHRVHLSYKSALGTMLQEDQMGLLK